MTLVDFGKIADASYPVRISEAKGVVAAFMMEFSEPDFLSGPFAEKFGLITIVDHRLIKYPNPILTETETYNRDRSYMVSRASLFPRALLIAAGLESDYENLSGKYHAETMEPLPWEVKEQFKLFSTSNTLLGSKTLDHPFLSAKTYDRSSVDVMDMIKIMRHMITKMSQEDALATLAAAELKVENELSTYLTYEFRSTPTVEEPFTLRVQGNDDMSYTLRFPSLEAAVLFAEKLELNATAEFVQSHMCFTN
jgi:hypothetical protein